MIPADEVRNAAQDLDRLIPGWWRNIEPAALNLADRDWCVCGQNDLVWADVVKAQGYGLWFIEVTSVRDYERLWLEEIAVRAEVRELVPV